ncbi:unnamed protein product [Clonostachys rosea f. rosea IK726]|uniref:Uncharacterized protein n=2 Tax=Bionectria ochroleuca TaxID=29856 RepID=A0A0B7KJH1_BIOOC|nr:unnamed protein product [Clonostachys rosea f. rosea IK726]
MSFERGRSVEASIWREAVQSERLLSSSRDFAACSRWRCSLRPPFVFHLKRPSEASLLQAQGIKLSELPKKNG